MLFQGLEILLLMILLISLLCLSVQKTRALHLAAQSSSLDLKVMEEANRMAQNSAWNHRCLNSRTTHSVRVVAIGSHDVVFTDYGTLIEAEYSYPAGFSSRSSKQNGSTTRIYRLYYDDFGIIKTEWLN